MRLGTLTHNEAVSSGPDLITVTGTSRDSGRTAVVAEEIDSVWLYLSAPGETRPQIACWILNTRTAPELPDFAVYRRNSAPPPLPVARLATAAPDPHHGRWSLLWSRDGNGVAALLDERPIAFAIAGSPRGYARYIQGGAEAWALPWDEKLFAATFA